MGLFKNLAGTMASFFQVGGPTGTAIKESGGVMQVRVSDDTAFARLQVDTPTADQDAVTKLYADTLEKPLIVSRQADTSASLPANTGVRGFVVVTTAGSGAVIGDLLYDDGSGAGTMSILAAVEGRTIAVTDALTGGTVTFDADSIYIWDADAGPAEWVKIGDIGNVTGPVRMIRFVVGTATIDSATSIAANDRIISASVDVTTPYSGGATIEVGKAGGTVDLLQDSGDNRPQSAHVYAKEQDTDWGAGSAAIRTTVTGAGVGASTVIVRYSNPNG